MKLPSRRTVILVVESLIFTIVVPGTVTIVIPAMILPDGAAVVRPHAFPQYTGLLLGLAGMTVYFWCLWHFVATARGIPAPLDHPRQLIVRGPYRYVRNPMYLGVLCVARRGPALSGTRAAHLHHRMVARGPCLRGVS